jgi:hypothetical protein
MNNLEKYNKYKLKYLRLKNQMKGGRPTGPPRKVDTLLTLANSGSRPEEPDLCQQCMWISIRDFLEYHRGINITVRDLKASVGLGRDTDKIEFDYYAKTDKQESFYQKLVELCKNLNITICLITISPEQTIYPVYLSDGKLANHDRINDDDDHPENEEVYIASFGRHFELIVEGPGYKLTKHTGSTTLEAGPYKPKFKVSNKCPTEFVPVEKLSPPELRLASYELELIGLNQELVFFNLELERVKSDLAIYRTACNDIDQLEELDEQSKEFLNKSNNDMIKELNAKQENINKQITRIKELINKKEKELYDKTNDEERKANETIKANETLIGLLEIDIKRLNQNIDSIKENITHISTLGLTPIQESQFRTQSNDSIVKYNKEITTINMQIEQLRDENETLGLLINN